MCACVFVRVLVAYLCVSVIYVACVFVNVLKHSYVCTYVHMCCVYVSFLKACIYVRAQMRRKLPIVRDLHITVEEKQKIRLVLLMRCAHVAFFPLNCVIYFPGNSTS